VPCRCRELGVSRRSQTAPVLSGDVRPWSCVAPPRWRSPKEHPRGRATVLDADARPRASRAVGVCVLRAGLPRQGGRDEEARGSSAVARVSYPQWRRTSNNIDAIRYHFSLHWGSEGCWGDKRRSSKDRTADRFGAAGAKFTITRFGPRTIFARNAKAIAHAKVCVAKVTIPFFESHTSRIPDHDGLGHWELIAHGHDERRQHLLPSHAAHRERRR
jgi:hypothetical protein